MNQPIQNFKDFCLGATIASAVGLAFYLLMVYVMTPMVLEPLFLPK